MQIEGLTQKEIVSAQFDAMSRLGDERNYDQKLLYDKVRRDHLANVPMEGFERVYACRPFTEHSKQVMRDKVVSFMANVYGVEL